jgi:hypothetical protein
MDPEEFTDQPTTDESWVQHVTSAEAIKSVIQGTLHAQDLPSSTLGTPMARASKLEENWGPKTTALPDDSQDGDIAGLVDLKPDIPSDIHPALV